VHDLRTGETRFMSTAQLDFSYRSSALESHHVVSRVDLSLEPGDISNGNELISSIVRWRRENQPGGQNAGSVFTNPPDGSAGRLIEAAGCKGLRVGTAEVSTKHANFIQADPGGSADDVRALMDLVVQRVEAHSGVVLHPETVMVGFTSDPTGGPR
jgi:UDP-N-acetylmuramate dehydrogenase